MNDNEKFDDLIKCLDKLENDSKYGEVIYDTEHEGTHEDPKCMPYVSYTSVVYEFERKVYEFHEKNPEFELQDYFRLLEERNIKYIDDLNIDELDPQGTMACLMRIVRSERFGEGAILSALEHRYIQKLLRHLKDLTENPE